MLSGELYDASDKKLTKRKVKCKVVIKKNDLVENQEEKNSYLLEELLPHKGKNLFI
ncbi:MULTISPECIES: maltose acetyltransferase domain-containing protein [Winogradskyella]|uniref:maltose acetyltransferase domain-containing protein n=1 Tax=Winogradskyella TaxID=286104 RepID=UPI0027B89F0A|nr:MULTISPECIES: maltose acetyltransferase domain-containing protein [Winogradskyella]